ncbi:MAG: M23 family metallopeptidase [Bacteroidales bacterium]|nr:M23 family metallopeptidase [Bacteroidales bacterium]
MFKRLKNKFRIRKNWRITVREIETTSEVFSFTTTKGILITLFVVAALLLVAATYLITAHTAVRYLIPGYPNKETRAIQEANQRRIDSLENEVSLWAFQVNNIQRIVTGREPIDMDSLRVMQKDSTSSLYRQLYAQKDSILRNEVVNEETFNISSRDRNIEQLEGIHFFTPVKGIITQSYNAAIGHPYIDIAAAEDEIVYSVLDGTVISAGWNDDTGYTIQIQHNNNLVSIYKHNSRLLKKTGDRVSAGTPIAVIGDTGNLSYGIHLHFELWHNGETIDPTAYIKF